MVITLPLLASAAPPPPSAPGIRYALGGHLGAVNSLAVSRDGLSFASASNDGTVKIWRMSDGMLLRTFAPGTASIDYAALCVALSPDGTTVAVGDANNTIWLWRLADDSLIKKIKAFNTSGAGYGVYSLSYSEDGSRLAAAGTDTLVSGTSYAIKVFNTTSWKLAKTLTGHTSQILQIAYSPSSTNVNVLASLSNDLTLRLWNTATGATLQTINAFTSIASCLAFSNDGKQVAAGGQDSATPNYFARVWNVANPSAPAASINAYNSSAITAVAFSPDGTLLATGGLDSVSGVGSFYLLKTFTIATSALVNTFAQHDNTILALAFSADGSTLISSGADYEIRQWSVPNGTLIDLVTQFNGTVNDATFSADGSEMAVALRSPRVVQRRAVSDGTLIDSYFGGYSPSSYSPDGSMLAINGDTILNLATDATIRTVQQGTLIWFSADNQIVYTYQQGVFYASRLADGTLLNTTPVAAYGTVALSNDKTRMAAQPLGGSGLSIFSAPDGALIQQFPNANVGNGVALSSDGNYLAFGGAPDAYIYRVSDGKLMLDQPGNAGASVTLVAISPFGDSMAAYRDDGSITVTAIDPQHVINVNPLAYWNDQIQVGISFMAYTPDAASILLGRPDSTLLVCYNPAPAALATLNISPSQVEGGQDNFYNPRATVTINLPAPAGGASVALTSSDPSVSFGGQSSTTVLVPQGATSAFSALQTSSITGYKTVTITATLNGISRVATITLRQAIAVKAIACAPSVVQGGLPTIGVVTLVSAAPAGGIPVALTGNSYVTLPAQVTVPAGKRSVNFLVQTSATTALQATTIGAISGGMTRTSKLTLVPAALSSLMVLPASVQSGENSVGVIQLASAAQTDVTVVISSSNSSVASTDVTSVTIPAGQSLGTFNISTGTVTASTKVTFTANLYGISKTAALTVTP
jgi:WD40 repeat protein